MSFTQQNEITDRASAVAALDADAVTYRLDVTTTTDNVQLAVGEYVVFLKSADSTATVYLALGATNAVAASEPSNKASAAGPAFRGDLVERVRVESAKTWVAAILSAAATSNSLRFVKVLPL